MKVSSIAGEIEKKIAHSDISSESELRVLHRALESSFRELEYHLNQKIS